ncbi:NUDIX domain-containing protein [Candidatus Woesearchaeota archaeon]|nr:NUDIX domain-containing protein [Candidatus Woesearchaeota archaeon]
MDTVIQSASLCPIRTTINGLEVLLTRRAFWNFEKNRPMRYPGEWVFAGGSYETSDVNLAETAVREFREELKYEGSVNNIKFLRSGYQNSHGKRYFVEFYTASIDLDSSFTLTKEGEVLAVQWFKPKDAITLIRSEQFTCEQAESFKQKELAHTKYGIYAVNERQFPVQNVQTLELIQSIPELTRLYKNG